MHKLRLTHNLPGRWARLSQLPVCRGTVYKWIAAGSIDSVLIQDPGARKGVRLVDLDSLDRYLEAVMASQKAKDNKASKEVLSEATT